MEDIVGREVYVGDVILYMSSRHNSIKTSIREVFQINGDKCKAFELHLGGPTGRESWILKTHVVKINELLECLDDEQREIDEGEEAYREHTAVY